MSGKTVGSPSEVYRRAVESRLGDLYTALPGTVQTYYPDTQTADVQPVIRRTMPTIDDDTVTEDLPVLPNVPVLFPRGGGYSVTWPLVEGDSVEIIVQTYAFSQWRQSGETSDPGDLRLHSLGNAVCIPGLAPNVKAIPSDQAGADAYVIEGPNIKLGKDATDFVALASKVTTELNAIKNALSTATAAGGGAAVTYGTPYTTVGDIAATKVKAK